MAISKSIDIGPELFEGHHIGNAKETIG